MKRRLIGFAGMTHLGLNSAAAALARGFRVVCFDPDAAVIERLRRGDLPVVEPELAEAACAHTARTRPSPARSPTCRAAMSSTSPPTCRPTTQARAISRASHCSWKRCPAHWRQDAVLVVLCQVPPGFTRALRIPRGRLYYQVETLIFGRAVERALHPERFIVGCADPRTRCRRASAEFLAAFGCPILPMRYESAELAKISINLLPGRLGQHRQHAGRTLRADRRRLVGDRAGAQARQAHRAVRLSRAGPRHRRRQSRARSRHRSAPCRRARHRCRRGARLDREQPPPPRLGRCARCTARAARRAIRSGDRGAGARLQGEHAFDQEFAVARAARAAGAVPRARVRSGGAGIGGCAPALPRGDPSARRLRGRRCARGHDAVGAVREARPGDSSRDACAARWCSILTRCSMRPPAAPPVSSTTRSGQPLAGSDRR